MRYPADQIEAVYRDALGAEAIVLHTDGHSLRTTIRGVTFAGNDLDLLEPASADDARQRGFTLQLDSLCACELDLRFPVQLARAEGAQDVVLLAHLALGRPAERGGIEGESVVLSLTLGEQALRSSGTSGWFEDELVELQRMLPAGSHLRICHGCGLSDYSPLGHGLFGGLACFRGNPEAYRAVRSKRDLFAIWDTLTGHVQETHVCPAFEPRRPGTGYRG